MVVMPIFARCPPKLIALAFLVAARSAQASFLSGDALDTMADWVAIAVLILVPVGVIVLFWVIHILPEKVAEKRHHPQKDAITTLCLLSLFFGGLLWPLAWLWAYSRPVAYRVAYGTDKHDDYFTEMGDKARTGGLQDDELDHLRHELDVMAEHGQLPPKLRALRDDLDALKADDSGARTTGATPERKGGAA
jgi:CBS domain containing-hemolysin-like protein